MKNSLFYQHMLVDPAAMAVYLVLDADRCVEAVVFD